MYAEMVKEPILKMLLGRKTFPLLVTSQDLINMVIEEWSCENIGFDNKILNKITVGKAMKKMGFTPYRNDMRRGWLIKNKEEVEEKWQSRLSLSNDIT